MNNEQIPFQIKHLLDNMLNPRDNVYVRGNYRQRLDTIRREIDTAIKKYDAEVVLADSNNRKKKA